MTPVALFGLLAGLAVSFEAPVAAAVFSACQSDRSGAAGRHRDGAPIEAP